MKRISIIILLILIFCGCESKTPYIPRETISNAISIGNYEYRESVISTSSDSLFRITSRGIYYMDNDVLTVYSPSLGTSNQVCYDPLCSHGMGSDCAYQFMIYGSVAEQMGDRLYWYDHDKKLEKMEENDFHYRICSTDLTGQDFKILYRNSGNYISEIVLGDERIYFTEQIGDGLNVLCSIDYSGKNLKTQPYIEGEKLAVSAFSCMSEEVYYVANGELCVCDAELKNNRILAQIGDVPLYADTQNRKLYYTRGENVYCYDPGTEETTTILTIDKGMEIINRCVTSEGIYYQMLPDGIGYASLYEDYISCLNKGYNKLYRYDFSTGEIAEIVIPEGLYIFSYTVADDLVFGIKCNENSNNQTINGKGYFCWNMMTGEVTDVS